MIAPTSDHRIAMVAKEATGFIYVVSSLGVTGVRSEIKTDIGALVEQIRAVTDVPCAVGFGISEPEQAKKMAGLSDGAIVGSAVVKRIAKYGKDCVPYVAEYVKEMKQAVKGKHKRVASMYSIHGCCRGRNRFCSLQPFWTNCLPNFYCDLSLNYRQMVITVIDMIDKQTIERRTTV